MLSILGFITGLAGPISNIVANLTNLQADKVKAQSSEEIAQIEEQIQALHDKRAVLVAEAGSRFNAILRGIFSIAILTYPAKIFFFDKVVGSFTGHTADIFTTDALTSNDTWILMTIVGFYFLGSVWPSKQS